MNWKNENCKPFERQPIKDELKINKPIRKKKITNKLQLGNKELTRLWNNPTDGIELEVPFFFFILFIYFIYLFYLFNLFIFIFYLFVYFYIFIQIYLFIKFIYCYLFYFFFIFYFLIV